MSTTPRHPSIHLEARKTNGNAFAVVGTVSRALRAHGVPAAEVEAYCKEAMSKDYNHLLKTSMEWVHLS